MLLIMYSFKSSTACMEIVRFVTHTSNECTSVLLSKKILLMDIRLYQ